MTVRSFATVALTSLALSVPILTLAASLPPGQSAIRVSGGGTGEFQDTPNAVNTSGFTDFSVGVTVDSDGTAQGYFVCMIPGVVVIALDVTAGTENADGSVTVSGLGFIYDHFFQVGLVDVPATVTFRAGRPGVGGFDFRDESGFFGPGQFDTELLTRGMIRIDD